MLARHAKSGWDQAEDFDRTLNKRGEADALKMSAYLHQCGYLIHQIITSDAVRALTTAETYESQLKPAHGLITHHDMYLASKEDIINISRKISADESTVMLVGHNPGMHEVLNYFAEGKINDMPSCSVAIIQFDVENWSEINNKNGDLLAFEYPKKITE